MQKTIIAHTTRAGSRAKRRGGGSFFLSAASPLARLATLANFVLGCWYSVWCLPTELNTRHDLLGDVCEYALKTIWALVTLVLFPLLWLSLPMGW